MGLPYLSAKEIKIVTSLTLLVCYKNDNILEPLLLYSPWILGGDFGFEHIGIKLEYIFGRKW